MVTGAGCGRGGRVRGRGGGGGRGGRGRGGGGEGRVRSVVAPGLAPGTHGPKEAVGRRALVGRCMAPVCGCASPAAARKGRPEAESAGAGAPLRLRLRGGGRIATLEAEAAHVFKAFSKHFQSIFTRPSANIYKKPQIIIKINITQPPLTRHRNPMAMMMEPLLAVPTTGLLSLEYDLLEVGGVAAPWLSLPFHPSSWAALCGPGGAPVGLAACAPCRRPPQGPPCTCTVGLRLASAFLSGERRGLGRRRWGQPRRPACGKAAGCPCLVALDSSVPWRGPPTVARTGSPRVHGPHGGQAGAQGRG